VATCFYAMLLWHFIWMYYEHTAAAMNVVFINFPYVIAILASATLLPARVRGPAGHALPRAGPAPA
jgi:hypothetical protein